MVTQLEDHLCKEGLILQAGKLRLEKENKNKKTVERQCLKWFIYILSVNPPLGLVNR